MLPFCSARLTAEKPKGYPAVLRTWGDHIKKRRLELRLRQKDVAALLEVNVWTVINWEHDRCSPSPRTRPRIIRFLGYDPAL
jgi:DNA-binding transcriptional regulator YiaG